MDILQKLQNLPLGTRKFILWSAVVMIGLALLFFWGSNLQKRIRNFQKGEILKEIKTPELEEEIKGFPSIKIPNINNINEPR